MLVGDAGVAGDPGDAGGAGHSGLGQVSVFRVWVRDASRSFCLDGRLCV